MGRRTILLLATAVAVTGCDLEFVAVDEQPTTGLVVASSQDDQLTVRVDISHSGIAVLPTVLVGGDTAAAEWLGNGSAMHHAELPVDSLDPFVDVRIVRSGQTSDFSIPLLVRNGPAEVVGEVMEIPVRFPQEAGLGSWSPHGWTLEVVDAEERRLLVLHGNGDLPDPLRVNTSMLPPGAAEARVMAVRADSHGAINVHAAGAVRVDLPAPHDH